MRVLILVVFSFTLVSCSSWFKRRACNKTNWFAHGEKVAMSGKRLDEDGFINECRKVEADVSAGQLDRGFKKGMGVYCRPETAYETGRKGAKLSKDLCDGPGWRKLVIEHKKGVRTYCEPENGVSAGATGVKYNYICPKKMERAFLKEFKKGRKRYLAGEVEVKREEIQVIDDEIRRLTNDRRGLQRNLSNMDRGGNLLFRRGGRYIKVNKSTTPEEREAARDDLKSEIRSAGSRISSKQRERKRKLQEISDLKREMVKL